MVICLIVYLCSRLAHEYPLKLKPLHAQRILKGVSRARDGARDGESETKRPTKKQAKRIHSALKVNGVRSFTSEELAKATENFSAEKKIGQGGYGKVYLGTLQDGQQVAIKVAARGSVQGSNEFYTEIELLSRVHHKNLVALVGYCDEENHQMLVYEFMPGGSIRDHLSGERAQLDFPTRLRIALGSARGILYLHTDANPPIFHRDIKGSNILLDARKVAKVADFGLSCLAPVPDTEGVTPAHVSTVVKGTPGYLDPEYWLTQQLTDKSDVYSFGVVLLELLTGMQAVTKGKNIVREVTRRMEEGEGISQIVDPHIAHYEPAVLEWCLGLALRCCSEVPEKRPAMAEVVSELERLGKSHMDTFSMRLSTPASSPRPLSPRDNTESGGVWAETVMHLSPR